MSISTRVSSQTVAPYSSNAAPAPEGQRGHEYPTWRARILFHTLTRLTRTTILSIECEGHGGIHSRTDTYS